MRRLFFGALFLLCARPAWAQDQDAMLKWTEAKVVHYRVVGEFSGKVRIFLGGKNLPSLVTDRVEIEFDWNQEQNKLVRPPVIRNFPSTAGAILPDLGCPASKVSGGFEFTTVLSLKDHPDETMRMTGAGLIMESRRDHPGGEGPLLPASASQSCGAKWEKVDAKSVTSTDTLKVPLAMMLAMGKFGGGNLTPDGKSLVEKPKPGEANEGWTWTFTPTVVK
jgi:hypothetical protein